MLMRLSVFLLLFTASAMAQETPALSEEEAIWQKLTQLAALTPNSDEFRQTWSEYVVEYVGSADGVEDAIQRVIDSAAEFRKELRTRMANYRGTPLSSFEMRDLMNEIAAEALDNVEN